MPKDCPPSQLRRSCRTRSTTSSFTSKITQYYHEFQRRTRNHKLVTFSKHNEQWEEWTPPVVVALSGAMTSASPPIYQEIPGYTAPRCAHILDPLLTERDCSMVVTTIRQNKGTQCYILKAPHQGCQFTLSIALKEEKLRDVENDPREEDNIDLVASSECSLSLPSTPTSSSSSSLSSLSSNMTSSSLSASSSSLFQRPKPRPLTGSRLLTSFFTDFVAKARASPDYALIASWKYAYSKRCFEDYPALHPAYQIANTPNILMPYDLTKPSNLCATIFCHSQFYDTAIGRVVRALNGRNGIPESTFTELKSSTLKCTGCLCEFSPDGYNSHLAYQGPNNFTPRCMNMTGCPSGKLGNAYLLAQLPLSHKFSQKIRLRFTLLQEDHFLHGTLVLVYLRMYGHWCRLPLFIVLPAIWLELLKPIRVSGISTLSDLSSSQVIHKHFQFLEQKYY
ncbi:hypothetical protein BT96DRAFT_944214 [Gymnopus androsaceus JB14]|uniref:Uncharacterized protein n=1 Tax=Gymnopus androsaceus JB14 TaxID=1447944 RepID=A0A6A4H5H1_9AGAR|nr:hypothetical protein BT96DRAFT_944214 [Gymnopus androsaceus JB14]